MTLWPRRMRLQAAGPKDACKQLLGALAEQRFHCQGQWKQRCPCRLQTLQNTLAALKHQSKVPGSGRSKSPTLPDAPNTLPGRSHGVPRSPRDPPGRTWGGTGEPTVVRKDSPSVREDPRAVPGDPGDARGTCEIVRGRLQGPLGSPAEVAMTVERNCRRLEATCPAAAGVTTRCRQNRWKKRPPTTDCARFWQA